MLGLALGLWLGAPAAANAACAATGILERERSAQVILVGEALPGDTDPGGYLLSPATFRVLRYEKGSGPAEVRVTTATRRTTLTDGRPGYVTVSEGSTCGPGRRSGSSDSPATTAS